MTYTKKQILPALHNSSKVPNPDLNEIGEKNYTSTILKYANLALPFPQLETDAKTVVPAINEVRVIPNPDPSGEEPAELNTVKIQGTIYKIEGSGGGGDYTAGAGIYFTGDNNSVINADAGRFSPEYTNFYFDTSYAEDYQGDWGDCWVDSGTTVDTHKIYQSNAGTYRLPNGDSLCTFNVGGYDYVTIYAKQHPETSGFKYLVFGNIDKPIDLAKGQYLRSCKDYPDSDYISQEYSLGGYVSTIQLLYHKESVVVDLNDGQFVATDTTVDNHPVYKSDEGSYHVDNGKSICTLHFSEVTSITIYFRSSSEEGYDWAYVGNLDEDVSSSQYKARLSGNTDYQAVTYTCSNGPHYIQVMYAKDGSVDANDDRAYFYYVVNECSALDDDRALAYVVPRDPYNPGGEIFNDYTKNRAIGNYSHAEGVNTLATSYASHAEGYGTLAQENMAHAEGSQSKATGYASHTEGSGTQATYSYAHAEGMDTISSNQASHAEGNSTTASGGGSHAEGWATQATGSGSHAEGNLSISYGKYSHSEGDGALARGESSHAEGWLSRAEGNHSHAEGQDTVASGVASHAEGVYTTATGYNSHAEGNYTQSNAEYAHSEGQNTVASGVASHAEGYGDSNTQVTASGQGSHAEGGFTSATADFAHAEGRFAIASGLGSHAEGYGGYGGQYNTATGIGSHAEGSGNLVSGNCGHAEGTRNTVYSESGHADGSGNRVYGHEAHGEGAGTLTVGRQSHTEGAGNSNIADVSHVEGGGNRNTYNAYISHTEGAGNINYGYQAHLEGSGNRLSGEESHLEGAGNMLHGHKSHVEGGGNIAYTFGSHVEGKHNTAVGYGQHAEGINNYVGFNGTPGYFSYGTAYEVGDIVGVNTAYLGDYSSAYPESDTHYLYRCITAPGQIQQSSTVNIVTPDIWDSSVTYQSGAVVQLSGVGFYYNYSLEPVTGTMPTVGWPWRQITSILSPFTSSGSGYYLLDCDGVYGANKIAVVYDNVQPMWEPLPNTNGGHVEGVGNIAIGDYQHVQGKYNVSDANKSFIIGNGTADNARSNALTVDWSGNLSLAGDVILGIPLDTVAQTISGAINELAAGGGSGGTVTPIPAAFINSLFS